MIPKEAMTMANFERSEKGLPPLKAVKLERSEPEPPTVEGQIKFADIPHSEIFEFSARRRGVKNKDLVSFTGYDTYLENRDGTITQGWLGEGEFMKLRRRIESERPDLLQKIGL